MSSQCRHLGPDPSVPLRTLLHVARFPGRWHQVGAQTASDLTDKIYTVELQCGDRTIKRLAMLSHGNLGLLSFPFFPSPDRFLADDRCVRYFLSPPLFLRTRSPIFFRLFPASASYILECTQSCSRVAKAEYTLGAAPLFCLLCLWNRVRDKVWYRLFVCRLNGPLNSMLCAVALLDIAYSS